MHTVGVKCLLHFLFETLLKQEKNLLSPPPFFFSFFFIKNTMRTICSICLEEVGKEPLISLNDCGHVFDLKW